MRERRRARGGTTGGDDGSRCSDERPQVTRGRERGGGEIGQQCMARGDDAAAIPTSSREARMRSAAASPSAAKRTRGSAGSIRGGSAERMTAARGDTEARRARSPRRRRQRATAVTRQALRGSSKTAAAERCDFGGGAVSTAAW
ncbi:hypothetical protein Scep_010314 [Stephania cephalantha]|uniref:Uncharacterized protein n=1 Tax=Stephania cephalantha TaxID=152367 RepID=A0AAP0PD80_9MAGN